MNASTMNASPPHDAPLPPWRTPTRAMTYNIRLGIQRGLPALAQVIQAHSPDLLAIQEVGQRWIMGPEGDTTEAMRQLTGLEHATFAPCILREPDARYGHALLSRWPLDAIHLEPLPQRQDEPRALLHARVLHPDGPLTVLATHLSWLPSDRPDQGLLLLERVEQALAAGQRLILMGDLNEDDPHASWLDALKQRLWDADAAQARMTYPSDQPRHRLDYLMTNIAPWQRVQVTPEAHASDHYPVAASLLPQAERP